MKKKYMGFLKKTAAALCTASLLFAAVPEAGFCTVYAEETSVYDVVPESVTISYGCALGDIGLPDSELGSLVWASPDYVPTESEESCRAFLYPEDGVDLTGEEDWDEDEGAVVVYITVVVSGAEEDTWEEEYQEEEYVEAGASEEESTEADAPEEENTDEENSHASEEEEEAPDKESTDSDETVSTEETVNTEGTSDDGEDQTREDASDTEEVPDKAEAAAGEETPAEDATAEEASAEEEPSSAEESGEEDPSHLKTEETASKEGQMKAAEETGSAFGIAGSDTVVGGEIAQGNYNTTPVPEGNGAAVQETTGGQGQTGPVTGPASAGSFSQQTGNVQNSGNNTQAAQASTQNVAGVRTGDDTNITPMVILIAAAAVVIIAAIIALLMKRRK